MAQKIKRSSASQCGVSETAPKQTRGSAGQLRDELETLLLLGAELGWKDPEVKAAERRIEKRYGDKIAMLMQIAKLRGDQSRTDVKGIDDEYSENQRK